MENEDYTSEDNVLQIIGHRLIFHTNRPVDHTLIA